MESLKKLRITIGTGCGLRKDSTPISGFDRAGMVMLTKSFLLTNCGGYTMTTADGGWRDAEGTDWEEPSLGFVVIIDEGKIIPEALAQFVRDTFCQVCVMLTVEEVNTRMI